MVWRPSRGSFVIPRHGARLNPRPGDPHVLRAFPRRIGLTSTGSSMPRVSRPRHEGALRELAVFGHLDRYRLASTKPRGPCLDLHGVVVGY